MDKNRTEVSVLAACQRDKSIICKHPDSGARLREPEAAAAARRPLHLPDGEKAHNISRISKWSLKFS